MGILLLILIVAVVVVWVLKKRKDKKKRENDLQYPSNDTPTGTTANTQTTENQATVEKPEPKEEPIPYVRKNLLTKNEWYFYKNLKPIADKLGVTVLAKVRVADLVEPETGMNKSQWQTAFNKINKKHIDFMLCNPDNLYPLLLIELDDNSHAQTKQVERDHFIEALYQKTGYELLRVKGEANLEEKIRGKLQK